jgi:hypothetical protein
MVAISARALPTLTESRESTSVAAGRHSVSRHCARCDGPRALAGVLAGASHDGKYGCCVAQLKAAHGRVAVSPLRAAALGICVNQAVVSLRRWVRSTLRCEDVLDRRDHGRAAAERSQRPFAAARAQACPASPPGCKALRGILLLSALMLSAGGGRSVDCPTCCCALRARETEDLLPPPHVPRCASACSMRACTTR